MMIGPARTEAARAACFAAATRGPFHRGTGVSARGRGMGCSEDDTCLHLLAEDATGPLGFACG